MKKTKRFLAVVLCMLLMLTPLAVVAETVTVQAAGPQTVKVKLDKKTGKNLHMICPTAVLKSSLKPSTCFNCEVNPHFIIQA